MGHRISKHQRSISAVSTTTKSANNQQIVSDHQQSIPAGCTSIESSIGQTANRSVVITIRMLKMEPNDVNNVSNRPSLQQPIQRNIATAPSNTDDYRPKANSLLGQARPQLHRSTVPINPTTVNQCPNHRLAPCFCNQINRRNSISSGSPLTNNNTNIPYNNQQQHNDDYVDNSNVDDYVLNYHNNNNDSLSSTDTNHNRINNNLHKHHDGTSNSNNSINMSSKNNIICDTTDVTLPSSQSQSQSIKPPSKSFAICAETTAGAPDKHHFYVPMAPTHTAASPVTSELKPQHHQQKSPHGSESEINNLNKFEIKLTNIGPNNYKTNNMNILAANSNGIGNSINNINGLIDTEINGNCSGSMNRLQDLELNVPVSLMASGLFTDAQSVNNFNGGGGYGTDHSDRSDYCLANVENRNGDSSQCTNRTKRTKKSTSQCSRCGDQGCDAVTNCTGTAKENKNKKQNWASKFNCVKLMSSSSNNNNNNSNNNSSIASPCQSNNNKSSFQSSNNTADKTDTHCQCSSHPDEPIGQQFVQSTSANCLDANGANRIMAGTSSTLLVRPSVITCPVTDRDQPVISQQQLQQQQRQPAIIIDNSAMYGRNSNSAFEFFLAMNRTPPLLDFSRFNPNDYPIEDCDERARMQRAFEIAEGVDPPPGFQPSVNISTATVVTTTPEAAEIFNSAVEIANMSGAPSTVMQPQQQQRSATAILNRSTPPTNISLGTALNMEIRIIVQQNAEDIPRIVHSQVDYIHCLVPDLKKITSCGFYWGKMDRYEAERLLDNKPEGTFLLRDSAQEDFLFSVSFRKYGRSLHARIEQFNHKFSFDCHDPGVYTSSTVTGLLEHYKDPACVMFFEPALTLPLNRNFSFTLQQLCRAAIVSNVTYDGINELCLPVTLKSYLKEYHYKQRVRLRRLEDQQYYSSGPNGVGPANGAGCSSTMS